MLIGLRRTVFAAAVGFATAGLPFGAGASGPPDPLAALGPALGAEALSALRARGDQEEMIPPAGNTGTVAGNLADGATTGSAVMEGSVRGNSGFTTVFQNTGNNVLFQNTTVVNITVR